MPYQAHLHVYNIPVQKAEPLWCLALRTRTGRYKSSFVPWELSLPTLVAHGHGQLSTWTVIYMAIIYTVPGHLTDNYYFMQISFIRLYSVGANSQIPEVQQAESL